MTRTYGYSPTVGEWMGSVPLAESERAPVPGVRSVLQRLRALLEPSHRVSELRISWAEYGADEEELAFHELEVYPVASWEEVLAQIERLRSITPRQFAISCLFLEFSTRVIEPAGEAWLPESAVLQLSIDQPELHPTTVEVAYTTHIDAWLSTTYDESYQPRSNHEVARANRPMLEALLRSLRELMGPTFQVDRSRLYPFAITDLGFCDVVDLPARRPSS
jgi:DNA-binding transcriptional regulator/RsmH inhibitor MraZ